MFKPAPDHVRVIGNLYLIVFYILFVFGTVIAYKSW